MFDLGSPLDLSAGGGGGGIKDVAFSRRSSGDITLTNNAPNWNDLDNTLDLTLNAAEGDVVEIKIQAYGQNQANYCNLDVVSIVAGSPVNSWGKNAAAPGLGIAGCRVGTSEQNPISGQAIRALAAGDIENDQVTLRIRYQSNGGKVIDADATQSNLIFTAINYGQ